MVATVAVSANGLNVVGVEVGFQLKLKVSKINTSVHCPSSSILNNIGYTIY